MHQNLLRLICARIYKNGSKRNSKAVWNSPPTEPKCVCSSNPFGVFIKRIWRFPTLEVQTPRLNDAREVRQQFLGCIAIEHAF